MTRKTNSQSANSSSRRFISVFIWRLNALVSEFFLQLSGYKYKTRFLHIGISQKATSGARRRRRPQMASPFALIWPISYQHSIHYSLICGHIAGKCIIGIWWNWSEIDCGRQWHGVAHQKRYHHSLANERFPVNVPLTIFCRSWAYTTAIAIISMSVCLSVCPSVCLSATPCSVLNLCVLRKKCLKEPVGKVSS
jgi:hypothetical protein